MTVVPVDRSHRIEWPVSFKLDQAQQMHSQLDQAQTERRQQMQTSFKLNSHTTDRLHERAIKKRLKTADWNRLYCDKTGIYRPCILISQPEKDTVRLVFKSDLAKIDECMRDDRTFLERVCLDTVG